MLKISFDVIFFLINFLSGLLQIFRNAMQIGNGLQGSNNFIPKKDFLMNLEDAKNAGRK